MSYRRLLGNQRVLHAAITVVVMNIVYCTLDPILSLRLPDYNLSDTISGLVFGVMPLAYMISTLLYPYIIPKRLPNRVTLITSLFGLSLS